MSSPGRRQLVLPVVLALTPLTACPAPKGAPPPMPPPPVAPAPAVVQESWSHPVTRRDSVLATGRQLYMVLQLVNEYGLSVGGLPPTIEPVLERNHAEPTDVWGRRLRYRVQGSRFQLSSAGSDGQFESGDDIVAQGLLGREEPCELRDEYRVYRYDHATPTCIAAR
jgi:hypothetical protein